jgi:hypothetical protein
MKTVSDLLREADPLSDDVPGLDDARDRVRRTVIAAAAACQSPTTNHVGRRRAVGAVMILAAALAGIGVFLDTARGTLQAAVRFEVRLAETQPAPGLIVARLSEPRGTLYLHPELIVTNDDISQSWITQDGPDRFAVSVQLLDPGAQRMRQATASHLGRPLAILIDGEVVAAPVVRSAIGNSAMVSGNFTRAEAERIVEGISLR